MTAADTTRVGNHFALVDGAPKIICRSTAVDGVLVCHVTSVLSPACTHNFSGLLCHALIIFPPVGPAACPFICHKVVQHTDVINTLAFYSFSLNGDNEWCHFAFINFMVRL